MKCRPPDRSRARPGGPRPPMRPAAGPLACRQRYRRDDDRRQRAKQYWPIRRASDNKLNRFLVSVFSVAIPV